MLNSFNVMEPPQLQYLGQINMVPVIDSNTFVLQSLSQQQQHMPNDQFQQLLSLQQNYMMASDEYLMEPQLLEMQNLAADDKKQVVAEVKKDFQNTAQWVQNKLREFHHKYRNIWGAVLILIGAFFCLFGRALLGIAVFLAATDFTFLAGMWLTFKGFDLFKVNTPSNTIFLVIMIVWALIGLAVGYCMYKMQKWGVIVLSIVAGVLCGHLIAVAAVVHTDGVHIAMMAIGAVAFMIFSCYCQNNIRIVLTSLIGSFLFIKGVADYAGGFPDMQRINQQIRDGGSAWSKFPKSFYAYLGGFVILVVLSFLFQRSQLKKVESKKEEEQKNAPQHVQTEASLDNSVRLQQNGHMQAAPNQIM